MTTTRLTLAAALAAGLIAPQAANAQRIPEDKKKEERPAKGPKLTKAVQAALAEAQKAIAAGDNAAALTQVRTAEAVANRTGEDNFYISQFKLQIGQATKDNAVLKEGIEGSLASGQVPEAERPKFVRNLAALAAQANDWQGAAKYYEQLVQMTPNDAAVVSDLAKIYIRNKQTPQAIATLQKAITAAEAQGQKPEEGLYGSRLQLAYDNKLTAEIEPAAQALVKAYPSPNNWNAALFAWRGANANMDPQTELDWFRLMRASGALKGQGEYLDYASTAQQRGLPAEAKAVLDEGKAKGVVSDGATVKELQGLVSPAKVSSDRAALGGLEKQARAAANGRLARATADGYLSHGDYAKAADLYRLALTKGGEDAAAINTRLGLALAMAGDKAGAQTAFAAVNSGPRAGLSRYYQIWLAQRA